MKAVEMHMDSIVKRVRTHGCVLMLDFDGTLSPIVAHHRAASVSSRTRALLRNVAHRFPTAIISGRALSDVRKRVGLPISYVGSHGLESRVLGALKIHVRIPQTSERIFRQAQWALKGVVRKYPDVKVENKKLCYAIHYRSLSPVKARLFVAEALAVINAYVCPDGIRVLNDMYTFDIMPDLKRTKGRAAYELSRVLRCTPSAIPIYIGDSSTDEDAFRALAGGITIRVGKSTTSAAQYYFKSRSGVDRFLRRMTHA